MSSKALPPLSQERVPGLDVLRSIAILFVLCHHYSTPAQNFFVNNILNPTLSVLWSGVDLFFVLSGFLIASQWFLSLEKDSLKQAVKKFYIKRSFRILPPYWIVFILYALQAQFLTHHNYNILEYLFFIQNFGNLPIFGVSWSLCVEEHFYIFFPLIAYTLWKISFKGLALLTGFFFVGLSLYLRDYFWHLHVKDIYETLPPSEHSYFAFKSFYHSIYFPTYCRLDGLTCGVALAALRHYRPELWLHLQKKAHWIALLGVVGAVVTHLIVYNKYQWFSAVFGFLFLALSYSCLVFAASHTGNWLGRLQFPGTQKLSHLSYALYLIFPGVFTLSAVALKRLSFLENEPLLLIFQISLLLVASQVIYSFIEKPSLALRKKILKKT